MDWISRVCGLEALDAMAAGDLTPEQKQQLKTLMNQNHENIIGNGDKNSKVLGRNSREAVPASRGAPEKQQVVPENKDGAGPSESYSPSLEDVPHKFETVSLSSNSVSHSSSLQESSCETWTKPSEKLNFQTETPTASSPSNCGLQSNQSDKTIRGFANPKTDKIANSFRGKMNETEMTLNKLKHQINSLATEKKENGITIEELRKQLESTKTFEQKQSEVNENLTQKYTRLEQKNSMLEQEKKALVSEITNLNKENKIFTESLNSINETIAGNCNNFAQSHSHPSEPEGLLKLLKAQLDEANTIKQEYRTLASKLECQPLFAEIEKKLDSMKNDAQKSANAESLYNKQATFVKNIDKTLEMYGCSVYIKDFSGNAGFCKFDDTLQKVILESYEKNLSGFKLYGVPVGKSMLSNDFDSNKTEEEMSSSNAVVGFYTKQQEEELRRLREDNKGFVDSLSKFPDVLKLLEQLNQNYDKISDSATTVQKINETTTLLSEKLTKDFESFENDIKKKDLEIQKLKETQNSCIEDLKLSSESLQTEINSLSSEKKVLQKQTFEQRTALEAKHVEIINLQNEIENLRQDFSMIKGSAADALTKLDFKDPDKYFSLSMGDVDKMSLVEAQNALKKALYVMDMPLNKFETGIILYSLISRLERKALYEFIDVLHVFAYDTPIELQSYTQNMYNQYLATRDFNQVIPPVKKDLDDLTIAFDKKLHGCSRCKAGHSA
ncbi:hypothetical protein ACO0RG_000948 [Hanseniaspora osmophila]|uniref:Uncharacterized protein n=1 Tax=Hanseniaspora osmophila TaxID=56408 RepID=A0A1E5RNV5_9ASCO|nr:hypothetical protein AWRI3579_g588 [Hanseniaspora osmophila]